MKKFLASMAVGVLAVGVLAGPALAAKPVHDKGAPYTGLFEAPAGSLCDFDYRQTYTEQDTYTLFSDGRVKLQIKVSDVNLNLDTGATLHESVTFQITDYPDGRERQSGVFWKLRDENGKLVVVYAGQLLFDASFNLVKFTPNSDPGFAQAICTALGGKPA